MSTFLRYPFHNKATEKYWFDAKKKLADTMSQIP